MSIIDTAKSMDAHALSSGFLRSVEAFGHRSAVEVSGEALTYTGLFEQAASLAATLVQHQVESEPPLTAVFAYRSVSAFTGVLLIGAPLVSALGYRPLPSDPHILFFEIAKQLGGALNQDGSLDRKTLGERVFAGALEPHHRRASCVRRKRRAARPVLLRRPPGD